MDESLDATVEDKIKPLLDEAMQHLLGVTVHEIEEDITEKIKKSPQFQFTVDTSKPFKQAKKLFKKQYLTRLLARHSGNVSEAAKAADLDRRSIHRLIFSLKINVKEFRESLERGVYVREEAVKDIIETTLDTYKSSLNPEKLKMMYRFAPVLSKDIARELPQTELTLDEAEREFEKIYLSIVLKQNNDNISKTARAIGLRYETVHRKLKALGLLFSKVRK